MEHVDIANVGPLLARLRQAHGYSYRQLSDLTGLNPGSLEKWEKGVYAPRLKNLSDLLRFYGETVTVGYPSQGGTS